MANSFFERVYKLLKQIPKGKVVTYGQIAVMLGCPRMARQVGYALHVNPEPGIIPCHRVLNRCAPTRTATAVPPVRRFAATPLPPPVPP